MTNPPIEEVKTVLIGLGTVNIGVLKILAKKKEEIKRKHGIEFSIVGVADSSGVAVNNKGYGYEQLISLKGSGNKASNLEGYLPSVHVEDIVGHVDGKLLVESSPVNLKTGRPGLQAIQGALTKGWSVVCANKSPLVLDFDRLHKLSKKQGGQFLYSATVCGGLPVINVLQRDLLATNLIGLKGIFNATSNFILQELEKERDFNTAVEEAKRIGAAEADPSLDIDGYDTANKLYIIMKSFSDFEGSLQQINIKGIRTITTETIKEASHRGKRIKLLAEAKRKQNEWELSVEPIEVDKNSFLGTCDGWEMGIHLQTDYYEELYMKIYEEDPITTSAAVVRDMINTDTRNHVY